MRLNRQLVTERENFVLEVFKTKPGISIRGAQKLVIEKFGSQMRPHRLLVLRKLVTTEPVNIQPKP